MILSREIGKIGDNFRAYNATPELNFKDQNFLFESWILGPEFYFENLLS